jgi:tetratricopeptide (TPR) repeat protein
MEKKVDTNEINELFHKAVEYFNRIDAKKAYKMFQKIIEKDPKFSIDIGGYTSDNPYYYMGLCHQFYLHDFETAIEYYTKSVELSPNDVSSYESRGFCWLEVNKYDLALEDFRQATKLDDSLGGGTNIHPDLDNIIIEVENRLGGEKPNKEYDKFF